MGAHCIIRDMQFSADQDIIKIQADKLGHLQLSRRKIPASFYIIPLFCFEDHRSFLLDIKSINNVNPQSIPKSLTVIYLYIASVLSTFSMWKYPYRKCVVLLISQKDYEHYMDICLFVSTEFLNILIYYESDILIIRFISSVFLDFLHFLIRPYGGHRLTTSLVQVRSTISLDSCLRRNDK